MRLWHLAAVLMLFLASSVYASHSTTIVTANNACPSGYTGAFISYNYTNSHVNTTGSGADNYRQCTNFMTQTGLVSATTTCSAAGYDATLFDVYQASDSHVAQPGTLTQSDNYRMCANNSDLQLECYYDADRTPNDASYQAVAHLYQNSNSHMELPNLASIGKTADPDYARTVFCKTFPNPPRDMRAESVNDQTMNISWNPNGNIPGTEYTIYWGSVNVSSEINSVACTTTESWCLHSGLVPDDQYCYKGMATDAHSTKSGNSTSVCNSTTFTQSYTMSAYFDPTPMNIVENGLITTYLFMKNDGNVPDRFSIDFIYDSAQMDVLPEDTLVDIQANSWDRIQVKILAKNIPEVSTLQAEVRSLGNSSEFARPTFTMNLIDSIGIPGLDAVGVALVSLLGAVALFLTG